MALAKTYFDFELGGHVFGASENISKELVSRLTKFKEKYPKIKLMVDNVSEIMSESKKSKESNLLDAYLEFLNIDKNTSDIFKYLYVMKETTQDDLAKALGIKYNALRVHLKKLEPIIDYDRSSYPIKLKLAIEVIPSYVFEEENLKNWEEYKKEYEKQYLKVKQNQDFEIERIKRLISKR